VIADLDMDGTGEIIVSSRADGQVCVWIYHKELNSSNVSNNNLMLSFILVGALYKLKRRKTEF
jgi:hypothetical protein